MIDKLIQKIESKKWTKEIINDPGTQLRQRGYNDAIYDIKELLKEENNKPFNPVDFEFIYDPECLCYRLGDYLELENRTINANRWILQRNSEEWSLFDGDINNHFEGGIILKALGIIE